MSLKMIGTTLVLAVLVFNGDFIQVSLAQKEVQKTAPENWETQTFEISPIPDPVTPDVTLTVNSTADLGDASPGNGICAASNGACTLRAAVEEANATTATDEIIVPAGVYVINTELTLRRQVVITGAGRNQTIIDGNYAPRAFLNAANSGSNTIQHLTIRNAWNRITTAPWRDGGGIFNDGTLTLRDVTITGCRGYQGGGVYNGYDGGQPNKRTLYMDNVLLTNNLATSTELGQGGGGLFNGSRLNGVNVTITNNTANMQGGGFYNNSWEQEIVLRNFVISNNQALDGGGIMSDLTSYWLGYGVTLIDGVVSNNRANCCYHANQGVPAGGIDNNEGIMRLTNVAVYGNAVPNAGVTNYGYGGGIVNIRYMELINVSVTYNTAYYGAGIYNGNYNNWDNLLAMVNTTISNNVGLDRAVGSIGAGLFNTGVGRTRIVNSTITQNYAGAAGGIRVNGNSGLVELKNTILAGNSDYYGAQDCWGRLNSLGNNIVGNPVGRPRNNLPCDFLSTASDLLNVVPAMGPLAQDKIPAYHLLIPGSQAIDRGTTVDCPGIDAQGQVHPQGITCDIGADEFSSDLIYQMNFLPLAIR